VLLLWVAHLRQHKSTAGKREKFSNAAAFARTAALSSLVKTRTCQQCCSIGLVLHIRLHVCFCQSKAV
jgi:hypothetical protein